jgi:TPR repeat protein
MLDARSAIMLYEQAWQEGVAIAAFRLGGLYEQGVAGSKGGKEPLLPDPTQAWLWYGRGAAAGEPNALARLAERDEVTPNTRLQSFGNYAAAAERARREDWPDDAWRDWRYRRASLARLLAREGKMREVANEYAQVRTRYAPRPTIWRRLFSAE